MKLTPFAQTMAFIAEMAIAKNIGFHDAADIVRECVYQASLVESPDLHLKEETK